MAMLDAFEQPIGKFARQKSLEPQGAGAGLIAENMGLLAGGSVVAEIAHAAASISVCAKSLPVNSNGSPIAFASA